MKYKCCDPDCGRTFESEFSPPTVLGDPLCPECSEGFDLLLKELGDRGVSVSVSSEKGSEN